MVIAVRSSVFHSDCRQFRCVCVNLKLLFTTPSLPPTPVCLVQCTLSELLSAPSSLPAVPTSTSPLCPNIHLSPLSFFPSPLLNSHSCRPAPLRSSPLLSSFLLLSPRPLLSRCIIDVGLLFCPRAGGESQL